MRVTAGPALAALPVAFLLFLVGFLVGCGENGKTSSTGMTTMITVTKSTEVTPATTGAVVSVPEIVVELSGREEVPPVQTNSSGRAVFRFAEDGSASFRLEVTDLENATAAHVHIGTPGANGMPIVALFKGPVKMGEFTGVLAEGRVSQADFCGDLEGKTEQEFISAVLSGLTYVNVLTQKHPSGEIRGQIVIPITGTTGT